MSVKVLIRSGHLEVEEDELGTLDLFLWFWKISGVSPVALYQLALTPFYDVLSKVKHAAH